MRLTANQILIIRTVWLGWRAGFHLRTLFGELQARAAAFQATAPPSPDRRHGPTSDLRRGQRDAHRDRRPVPAGDDDPAAGAFPGHREPGGSAFLVGQTPIPGQGSPGPLPAARAPRHQAVASPATMESPEQPLRGAPCRALRRFLEQGLGDPQPLTWLRRWRSMARHWARHGPCAETSY